MFVGGSLFTHKLDNKKAAMKMSTSFLDTQLASLLPSLNDSMTFTNVTLCMSRDRRSRMEGEHKTHVPTISIPTCFVFMSPLLSIHTNENLVY